MSVLGFEEAFESCNRETLPGGTEIRIVTPALLAVMKIVAFSERGEQFPRDLQDLWFILERYALPPKQENRVFDELASMFPDDTYYEHLGPLLLGWDIGSQGRSKTIDAIRPVLTELASDASHRQEPLLPKTGDIEQRLEMQRKVASEFGWLLKGIDLAVHSRKS